MNVVSSPAIDARGLSKNYAQVCAVADGTLQCKSGELVTILGASGCGKSTLLRLICGLEKPDHGQVLIQNRDVTAMPPEQRPVNIVFQSYALFPHLSVYDNIAYGLKVTKQNSQTIRQRCGEIIDLMQLTELSKRLPENLSGGQQQRVALARALVMRPVALLLDEPLAALDAKLREQMRAYLGELQATLGITFLMVTHDQEEALVLSQRLAFMHEGRILQCDTPETVYRLPANLLIATFLGKMAFVPAQIDSDGNMFSAFFDKPICLQRNLPAGRITIGIRPEHVKLHKTNSAEKLEVAVNVKRVDFFGQSKLVTTVGVDQTILCAWLKADQPIPEGKLMASWEAASMLIFDDTGQRVSW